MKDFELTMRFDGIVFNYCGAKMGDTPTEKVDISTENTNSSTDEVEE